MSNRNDLKSQAVSQIQTNLARLKIMGNKIMNNLRKGENYELRTELNSGYREHRKEAVRRVIANMTVGKDVSGLFTDVLKNMQTDDIETKKLIYLYLMSYAKVNPSLVILTVNTFVKDSEDSNPLLRALAIRTMGCLHVPEILDYICDPLRRCLTDKDAYVRKTSVVCVAKVYELSPEVAMEQGLLKSVIDMICDSNALVVSNAVASLKEINDIAKSRGINEPVWALNESSVGQLLSVINECTEWGQISILEALTDYEPASESKAIKICDAVLPRLQHVNGSVVLTAIRLILDYEKYIRNLDVLDKYSKKMVPPLISLVSSTPEIQFVALRSISLVLDKHPLLLSKQMNMFFLKYNDPDYVKFEKMNLLVKLCTEENIEKLLSELGEYSKDVDANVCRRAIRALERTAMNFPKNSEKCVDMLIELIELRNVDAIQESTIALSNIGRAFSELSLGKISTVAVPLLCGLYELLETDSKAKSSLISMVGQSPSVDANTAFVLLEGLVSAFMGEDEIVQLAIVHSSVSFFLRNPDKGQSLVLGILQQGTESCSNVDVRDVSYIYWRLLSANPEVAKQVVLAEKPSIIYQNDKLPKQLLKMLLENLGNVSSVLQLPPPKFLSSKDKKLFEGDIVGGVKGSSGSMFDEGSPEANNMGSMNGNADEEPELLISF
ncbi:hypothetical protein BB559_003538 [Furculomyces boomerangus]|uniref:AP complex subunit beta n=2 Tax=Harpellales TaxID=61421 RepID=A0A2T9YKP2_9FUNG|nr:hypothetical protein BB559_007037 [Furculomyces boomerangus]PVU85676.1 hypothetical protein BB559_006869 [Furculomyces boomerangus]PVU92903.1 hypothetical protein BB559_003538 [Furculomyces boomerangus]